MRKLPFLVFVEPDKVEYFLLYIALVDADAPASDLVAIQHQVVL